MNSWLWRSTPAAATRRNPDMTGKAEQLAAAKAAAKAIPADRREKLEAAFDRAAHAAAAHATRRRRT